VAAVNRMAAVRGGFIEAPCMLVVGAGVALVAVGDPVACPSFF